MWEGQTKKEVPRVPQRCSQWALRADLPAAQVLKTARCLWQRVAGGPG